MIKLICDRCGEECAPLPDYVQAPEFEYRVMYCRGLAYRNLDLCGKCQKDLDSWIKEKPKREEEQNE